MPDPAELLVVRDQYEQAHQALSRGLAAQEAGDKAKALECYRKGQQHLIQGSEVPVNGVRQKGAAWDTARKLQQRMKDTLGAVNTHLSDLETSKEMRSEDLLKNLPLSLCPNLASSNRPPQSSPNHLYPTVPAAARNNAPSAKLPPPRPPSPAAPQSRSVPAAAADMANPGDQPPAYTPQPTSGHLSLDFQELGSGKEPGPAGDGQVLLFIPSGVQMFFVAPDGQVSSLSSPGYLRIVAFESPNKDPTAGRPWTFLQVRTSHACWRSVFPEGVAHRSIGGNAKLRQRSPD